MKNGHEPSAIKFGFAVSAEFRGTERLTGPATPFNLPGVRIEGYQRILGHARIFVLLVIVLATNERLLAIP